jgi:hypothetical protein
VTIEVTGAYQRDRAHAERTATRPVTDRARKTTQPAEPRWTPAGMLRLQRSAGNAAVTRLVTGPAEDLRTLQRDTGTAPTPASVRAALDSIAAVSTRTVKVPSLQPWVIFETLPWNPSDGKKKTLYAGLKAAHDHLRKAVVALADAERREAAARSAPATAPTTAPAPAGRKPRRKAARALPTVAEAQDAVTKAQADITARTKTLKEYVKSKLGSSHNPKTAALRAEKTAATKELKAAEAKLHAAGRRKRPDPAATAGLTAARDAAQNRITSADVQLTALIEALRAQIDAADWGEREVEQTTTVYQVGDARASLKNRIDAYATVTGEGFEGSATRAGAAGPSVPELLAKDPTLGPSTRKILAIISRFEGGFTALNTWDVADVTFGMVQWTTGASGHGDLIRALTIMKKAAPDAFAARLVRYGIDVAPTGLVLTRPDGTVLTGVPAAKAVQSDPKLAAVLAAAGADPALQAAELRAANEIEVSGALTSRLSVTFPAAAKGAKPATAHIPVAALITSELGVGVLANHTVHGGFPKAELERAATAYVAAHHAAPAGVGTWGPQAESNLIAAITKGIDADRVAVMRKELNSAAGSFH